MPATENLSQTKAVASSLVQQMVSNGRTAMERRRSVRLWLRQPHREDHRLQLEPVVVLQAVNLSVVVLQAVNLCTDSTRKTKRTSQRERAARRCHRNTDADLTDGLHLRAPAVLRAPALALHNAGRTTTRGATSGGSDEDHVAGRFDVLPTR